MHAAWQDGLIMFFLNYNLSWSSVYGHMQEFNIFIFLIKKETAKTGN